MTLVCLDHRLDVYGRNEQGYYDYRRFLHTCSYRYSRNYLVEVEVSVGKGVIVIVCWLEPPITAYSRTQDQLRSNIFIVDAWSSIEFIVGGTSIASIIGTARGTGTITFGSFASILSLIINLQIIPRSSHSTQLLGNTLTTSSQWSRALHTCTDAPPQVIPYNTDQAISGSRRRAVVACYTGGLASKTLTWREIIVLVACCAGFSAIAAGIDDAAALSEGIAEIANRAGILYLLLARSRNEGVAPVVLEGAIGGARAAIGRWRAGEANWRAGQAFNCAGEIERATACQALSRVDSGAGCAALEAFCAVG